MRVSDFIAQFIEDKGITHVFMLSGGGMMHLQDSLSRLKKTKYVCHHHEQAATFAAEAYGRQRGGPGIVFATSGPGAANTVTGIISAFQDSSALIVIAGQAKRSETMRHIGTSDDVRQLGTFEVDMLPIVSSVTKFVWFLDRPEDVKMVMEKAWRLATTGRPGPVYIEVPLDVQGALIAL